MRHSHASTFVPAPDLFGLFVRPGCRFLLLVVGVASSGCTTGSTSQSGTASAATRPLGAFVAVTTAADAERELALAPPRIADPDAVTVTLRFAPRSTYRAGSVLTVEFRSAHGFQVATTETFVVLEVNPQHVDIGGNVFGRRIRLQRVDRDTLRVGDVVFRKTADAVSEPAGNSTVNPVAR